MNSNPDCVCPWTQNHNFYNSNFQTMEILELSSKEMPIFEIIEVIPFEKQFPLCFCTLKFEMGKDEDGKFST